MEKSWENFWTTGKVEDYLNYRNRVFEDENLYAAEQQDKEKMERIPNKKDGTYPCDMR